jgi:CheY-like chemotaxis protein
MRLWRRLADKEALKKIKVEKPNLVLLDIMMPDINGWDVSRTLKSREETKDIPIIMLTVRTSRDSVQKSFEYAMVDAHLGKPASGKEILRVIKSFLN